MEYSGINALRIAFVGFGEAAEAIQDGIGAMTVDRVRAYDIKSLDPATAGAMAARYAASRVDGSGDPARALAGAQVVFCLVTADQARAAAETCAPFLARGALWFDGNSSAPGQKRQAADVIERAGGRYLDLAIMAPIHPARHQTAMLLSGPHATGGAVILGALGMHPGLAGPAVGDASAVKMIRSVMVKGLEALTAECFLAARRAGVGDAVLASLESSDPALNWPVRGAYNLERMIVHGRRRAAEMREVAVTLRDLGLPPDMAEATAAWQDRLATLGIEPGIDDLFDRARRINGALK